MPTTSPFQRLRDFLPLILAGAAGGAFAWWRFGAGVIDPRRADWFRGDATWHFLTWLFFRHESLNFPPGRVESFLYPLGTSVGGGDALPLLAFPFKALSPWLPAEFQYLGLWLLLSYVLQGVFGYLLVRTFCPRRWLALPAALLFLLSPVMIFRAGHIALASHWLLLLALWNFFDAGRTYPLPRLYAVRWTFVVGLTGLVHPYLAAMVFPLALLSLLRESWHRRRLGAKAAAVLALGFTLLLGLEWWLSGMFGLGEGGGFDFFTLNPNAFFNPLGRSRFLPTLSVGPGQYEGFSYLGLGVLALGPLLLTHVIVRHGKSVVSQPRRNVKRVLGALNRRGLGPLALLCLGLAVFALGNTALFILEVVLFYALFILLVLRLPRLERFSRPPYRRTRAAFLLATGFILAAGRRLGGRVRRAATPLLCGRQTA